MEAVDNELMVMKARKSRAEGKGVEMLREIKW